MTFAQKLRAGIVVLALGAVALYLLPALTGGQPGRPWVRPVPTMVYEGTVIQFPYSAPDARTYREAQRRRDRAVLLLRWRGERSFEVNWSRTGHAPLSDRFQITPGDQAITTFSVIVDVQPDDYVYILGTPLYGRIDGWAQCMILHAGQRYECDTDGNATGGNRPPLGGGRVECDLLIT